MPAGKDRYVWHAGIYNIMKHLTDVIGKKNFIFATGDSIYYTADLLQKFRQQQYVFAFYVSKKTHEMTGGEVVAQQHDS